MDKHVSVLLAESLEGLNIKPDGIYVDLTLGRAGHSKEILKHLNEKGLLLGVDRDQEAINQSKEVLANCHRNFTLVKANFVDIALILQKQGIKKVDGILLDLGVSSPQFDDIERGFSYKGEAKLDMRMDRAQKKTAYDVVNDYSLDDLIRIFREYGDEKYAYSIAKNIIKKRTNSPIITTTELVDIIKKSKPAKELAKIGHPAKQVFQALRIEVNDELENLKKVLKASLDLLNPSGRLVVITFHSGEDKIVKDIFKEKAVQEGNRYNIGFEQTKTEYRLINRKVIVAKAEETISNHRAKSAKLRIIEKI